MTATASSLGLSAHQFQNLQGIVAAVKKRSWPIAAAIIACETALTESGMRILASANVPQSVRYPHDLLSWTYDGLGHDHASCGMYQQQTGYAWAIPGTTTMTSPDGWGTPAELMDPETSTEKFLDALGRESGWQKMLRWQAAQGVQHSIFADGSNYRQQDARATHYVQAVWGGTATKPVTKPAVKPTYGTYTVHSGDTLRTIAARFHTTWPALQKLNNLANPNTIRIGQVLRVPGGTPAPRPASNIRVVGSYTVRQGDTLVTICHRYPQAWVTPASVARINGISNPNHLVIGQVLRIGA